MEIAKSRMRRQKVILRGERCPNLIVRNLRQIYISSSSVFLSWSSPDCWDDQMVYSVGVRHWSYEACNYNSYSYELTRKLLSYESSIKITELIPYSNYIFSVVVVDSNNFEGTPESLLYKTDPADTISPDEIPKIEGIENDNNSVKIKFSTLDCSKIRGLLLIKLKAQCPRMTASKIFSYNITKIHYILKGLPTSSHCNMTIDFCRNITYCSHSVTKAFCTKSGTSRLFEDLSYEFKDEDSVSLKWKPSKTCTSIMYNVCYHPSEDSSKKSLKCLDDNIVPCETMTNYQCVILKGLKRGVDYNIMVLAKREHKENFIQQIEIRQPHDLVDNATTDGHMVLPYICPIDSSENTTLFKICSIAKDDYTSLCKYTIHTDQNDTVEAILFNDDNRTTMIFEDCKPPAIPLFERDPQVSATQDTIIVTISPGLRNVNKDYRSDSTLLILTSDLNLHGESDSELEKLESTFKHSLSKFRIVYKCTLANLNSTSTTTFIVGKDTQTPKCKSKANPSLIPESFYNVTVVLINTVGNHTKFYAYPFFIQTKTVPFIFSEMQVAIAIVSFVSLLVFITIIMSIIFICRSRRNRRTNIGNDRSTENQEVSIPLNNYLQYSDGDAEEILSQPVQFFNFEDYVKDALKNDELKRQYMEILNNTNRRDYEAICEILDFDRIDMKCTKKVYIATQVPETSTVRDFWTIIWEESIKHIVLLNDICSRNEEPFNRYWPEKEEKFQFGDVSIQLTECVVFPNYEYRKFILTTRSEERQVHHLLFTWGIGYNILSNVLFIVGKTAEISAASDSPILVHCSSGINRTAFIILCDICLTSAEDHAVINVLANSYRIASSNPAMLLSEEDYILTHLFLVEASLNNDTGTNCKVLRKEASVLTTQEILDSMLYLKNTLWLDHTIYNIKISSTNSASLAVYLNPLNAVTVDWIRCPGKFIIAQQPTFKNLSNFWKLVADNDISTIVFLNNIEHFWPNENRSQINALNNVTLDYEKAEQFDFYNWTTVKLHLHDKKKHRTLNIFSIHNWSQEKNCPQNVLDFVKFCVDSNHVLKKSNQILINSSDGVTACGLYIIMLYNMEKMKVDNISDICASIRKFRSYCPQFVENKEQLKFLWEAAKIYAVQFQSYESV